MGALINGRTPEEIKHWLKWATYRCEKTSAECATCEYSEVCGEYCGTDTYKEALAYIQRLEAQQPKWISVKERLPEDCVSVLVWAVYHNEDGWDWAMSEIDNYCDMVGWDNTADPEAREVTHWMPIPESPKEEQE